jgi:N6-L-threonylcarbamoyladenine synthase
MITLGIESSCDETSIALLENNTVLKNTTYSQLEHGNFGGVVPELASRAHLQKIDRLTHSVLKETDLTPDDITLIAVTDSPGLAGALLVGVSFALGVHTAHSIPVTGINHLEGHICSALLEYGDIDTPFLSLVVSGGHTALYRVDDIGEYTCLGETVDDAAGEAFDKVGKMLGFTYPAGRLIEEEAGRFSDDNVEIPTFPVARCSQGELHFSFSGLKTAVKYYLSERTAEELETVRPVVCRAFQQAIADSLAGNAVRAAELTGINRVAFVGGVACNSFLRKSLCDRFPGTVYTPSVSLCTDNAAMIALAGYKRYKKNQIRFPKMDPSRAL